MMIYGCYSIISQQENTEGCGCLRINITRKNRTNSFILKERIKQYNIWYFENEKQKKIELRLERRRERKLLARKHDARRIRLLCVFDMILWIVGIVFISCSSVKAFGEHSVYYKNKNFYRTVGSIILAVAGLFLYIWTVLKHRMQIKHKLPPKRIRKSPKKTDNDGKDPNSYGNEGNEKDIEMTLFGLQIENYLETNDEIGNYKGDETQKAEEQGITQEDMTLSEWPNVIINQVDETDNKRSQSRKAWAKTKWMRGESFDSDGVLDLTENLNIAEVTKEQEESKEEHV